MANFDIEMKNSLIEKLKEKNQEIKDIQDKFINNIDYSNSVLIEFELKNLCEEISKILRRIRICDTEIRRDNYIKEIIKNNSNIIDEQELEQILEKIPSEIRVKGRSESICKSKDFKEEVLYFLIRKNIISPRRIYYV